MSCAIKKKSKKNFSKSILECNVAVLFKLTAVLSLVILSICTFFKVQEKA